MNTVKRRVVSLMVWVLLALGAVYAVMWQKDTSEQEREQATRDKRISEFRVPDEVVKVVVDNAKGHVELERQDGVWRVVAPILRETDDNAVPSMLYAVLGLERIREVGEKRGGEVVPPTELGLFGLEPPATKMTLIGEDGREETILVGKRSSFDGALYLKRADAPGVYLVPGKGEHPMSQGLHDYRIKSLTSFDPASIQSLKVKSGATQWRIDRNELGFRMVEPVEFRASAELIEGVLGDISSMRLAEFYDYPGAPDAPEPVTNPDLEVELLPAGGEPIVYRFRIHGEGYEKFTVVEVLVGGTQSKPARLSGIDLVGGLQGSPARFRDMEVLAFDREKVEGMAFVAGDVTIKVERKSVDWHPRPQWFLLEPVEAEAHSPRLEGILYALRRAMAKDIVLASPTPEELEARGLSGTAPSIEILGPEGAVFGKLVLGNVQGEEQELYAGGRVVKVDKASLGSISFELADYRKQ